jgi:hypothetical protein
LSVVAIVAMIPAAVRAQDPCIELAQADVVQSPTERSARQSAEAQQRLLAPITESELQALLEALRMVEVRPPEAVAAAIEDTQSNVRIAERPADLTFDRQAVLQHDMLTILVKTHLDETLLQMRQLPNVGQGLLQWTEQLAQGMDRCLRQRYSGFGGDPAYEAVRRLALGRRGELEDSLLRRRFLPPLPGRPPGAPQ